MNSTRQINPLEEALKRRDLDAFNVLLAAGADIRYVDENGYDALINAAYAYLNDDKLIDVLGMLIGLGASLSTMSEYGESAVGVLSFHSRFQAVKFLLEAGADPKLVGLTPLMKAVAFGSVEDVEFVIQSGVDLEERERYHRTAWLIAVQSGDIEKAELLVSRGADINARGWLGRPSTFFAVESIGHAMLAWLLDQGIDIGLKDDGGDTVLCEAVDHGNAECVEFLVSLGVDVNEKAHVATPLWHACTKRIAMALLEAGADPNELMSEGRRAILGYDPEPDEEALRVSNANFHKYRTPRFGKSNPERMNNAFWEAMIRSGVNAYQAEMRLNDGKTTWQTSGKFGEPTWCADRFGQSITFLPDGRIVQVAGEHEDGSDPDFCIYNDVFVHDVDGSITIYGYPDDLFPPTDFHTATLVGEYIYLIGSVGYPGTRGFDFTPVYRLSVVDFHIEPLETSGDSPGWIGRHRAKLVSPHEISVSGGNVIVKNGDKELFVRNEESFVLDVRMMIWRRELAQ